jgi:ferredoxin
MVMRVAQVMEIRRNATPPARRKEVTLAQPRKNNRKNIAPTLGWYMMTAPNIMADVANRYPENLPGKYYVDNQCIDCDLCRETAPSNFGRNDDGGYSYVFKQPTTPDEEKLCKEAMEGCPVEAIGDNGS